MPLMLLWTKWRKRRRRYFASLFLSIQYNKVSVLLCLESLCCIIARNLNQASFAIVIRARLEAQDRGQ
jgi:hypothetical protein